MHKKNFETIKVCKRPVTPSSRFLALESRVGLNVDAKGKKTGAPSGLVKTLRRSGGRNNLGRVTSRFRGSGVKRQYREIDFVRNKDAIPATVNSIQYDPYRSARIALVFYADGEKRFVIAPKGLKVGDVVLSGPDAPFNLGCCLPMINMPVGMMIHNIELVPGRGAALVRSAGQSAQIVSKVPGYVHVKLPSNEIRAFAEQCRAVVGMVSNQPHGLREEGKAGRRRWQGRRPHVRGAAMNPVDHPRGGGEGKHAGHLAYSFSGKESKGTRTRKKKKGSSAFIVRTKRGVRGAGRSS